MGCGGSRHAGAVACLGILAGFIFVPFIAGIALLGVEIVDHFLLLVVAAAQEVIPVKAFEGKLYTAFVDDVVVGDCVLLTHDSSVRCRRFCRLRA